MEDLITNPYSGKNIDIPSELFNELIKNYFPLIQ